jgi:uncharacterized protein YbjQ (UPF0145 family)
MQETGFLNSGVPTAFMLFGAFVFFFIFLPIKLTKRKAQKIINRTSGELIELGKKVLVVSSGYIPGKEITHVIGHVTGTSRIEASCPEQADAAEREAKLDLMKTAMNMGANAIIDAKMTSSSHQQQGSQWMVSKTYYTGTAVII